MQTLPTFVPAAQYLRMSTERQEYSLEYQALAIQEYARKQNLRVVQTYADGARSGLVIRRRVALQSLLQDVICGNAKFKAVLVYDVSRWGRFQDADEAAHYEFLCKRAGIRVYYCAEPFVNDGSMSNSIMKALKRSMAAEYSREMGERIYASLRVSALQGRKVGGAAGYGMRRMLISPDGSRDQILNAGDYKALRIDRVILVPGPEDEIKVVREIFRMYVEDRLDILSIAKVLNERHVPFCEGKGWSAATIGKILANPKYIGSCVWGRTSQRLQKGTFRLPKERWIVKPHAFQPIISEELFDQAQQIRGDLPRQMSDAEMLERLRKLLTANGRLTQLDIDKSRDLPCVASYQKRFGTLRKAYALIGYNPEIDYSQRKLQKRNTIEVRDSVISQIADSFPLDIFVLRRSGKYRPVLWVRNGPMISVAVCRTFQTALGNMRWYLDPARRPDRALINIVVRCKLGSTQIKDLHVMPQIDRAIRFILMEKDPWLRNGRPLADVRQLLNVVRDVQLAQATSEHSPTLLGHGSRNRHERYSPRRVFEQRATG